MELAEGLRGLITLETPSKSATRQPAPSDASDELAWLEEVRRLAIIYFGSRDITEQSAEKAADYADQAARIERHLAGLESHRILGTFERTSNLQDRVARMLNRQLKAYREFQAARQTASTYAEDNPRNEPNPNM